MAHLALTERIPASVERVYAVVADVERYPEFLPDVAAVAVRGDEVSMTLRMGLVPVTLVTRVRFSPPDAIALLQLSGPFRRFEARWTFAAADADATDASYEADYELPLWGSLLAGPARVLVRAQAERQIRAFQRRAAPPVA